MFLREDNIAQGAIKINLLVDKLLLNARKSALVEQAMGSTFISVTREQIKELLIPLPPLPEQEKIVSYIKQYETILKSIQE